MYHADQERSMSMDIMQEDVMQIRKEGIMPVKSRIFCRSVVGQVGQFWGVIYIRRKTLYRVGVQELMGGIMQIKKEETCR